MKRRITVFSIVFAMFAATFVQASDISVSIDGITLETDVPAAIVEGRTLVPMRSIFEALDAKVEWDADSKSITASKDGRTVKMQINSKQYSVDGKNLTLDVPPMIADGRTLVPARAVSESLDCQV
ncbi:copper amine oxidase N-terminal domain-containing protein, partial [bacterium]|nr:copper amine oxidase N-terminal domain-containing protein [bacterium]